MPNEFGEPLPGEAGYGNTDWEALRNDPSYQKHKGAGGATPGGHFDPSRSGSYGNQAGFGDGSKFQGDFQQGHKDAWKWLGDNKDMLMGARSPDAFNFNQGMGQLQSGVNGTAQGYGAGQGQTRGMQMSLIQQLQDQASGNGPSLAQMQLQKGTDQNMAQAMALGASQRGAGQAGMLKGIQGQQAGMAQGMAGDAAMLRLQEQMQARQALGTQLGQTRGMDAQSDQFAAGQVNQQNVARVQAQQAAEDAKIRAWTENQRLQNEAAKARSPMGAIGGFMASMSDERLKTDIKPGEGKLYDFLDKLGSHEYEYKDPKHGDRRISPMAQELEKSDAGREFVFEAKDGKAVDYGKGLGTMLASQAALHKRLKKLEGK